MSRKTKKQLIVFGCQIVVVAIIFAFLHDAASWVRIRFGVVSMIAARAIIEKFWFNRPIVNKASSSCSWQMDEMESVRFVDAENE